MYQFRCMTEDMYTTGDLAGRDEGEGLDYVRALLWHNCSIRRGFSIRLVYGKTLLFYGLTHTSRKAAQVPGLFLYVEGEEPVSTRASFSVAEYDELTYLLLAAGKNGSLECYHRGYLTTLCVNYYSRTGGL